MIAGSLTVEREFSSMKSLLVHGFHIPRKYNLIKTYLLLCFKNAEAYLQMTSYTGSRQTPNPCRSSCSESLKVLQLPSTLFIRRHLNGGGSDIEAGTKPWEKKIMYFKDALPFYIPPTYKHFL